MQAYHFEKMSIALQTVQNQASIETLSRAEQHTHHHFNLALLTDHANGSQLANTLNDLEQVTMGATPSTSAEETIPKFVHRNRQYHNTKLQVTGTAPPTCRPSSSLVDEVPAGYESDDSWGYHAPDAGEDQTPDLEEELLPFLTFQMWAQHPSQGRGCHHRQYNRQIPVRDGYAQMSWPWDGQQYGRCMWSQRALRARAYRKWQHHYQV